MVGPARWQRDRGRDGAALLTAIGEQFADHDASDPFVLNGGRTRRRRYLRATWLLDRDARTWTRIEPATVPIGRHYDAVVPAPVHELRTVSGYLSGVRDDAWRYDLEPNAWTEALPAGAAPRISRRARTSLPGVVGVGVVGGRPDGHDEFTDALWIPNARDGTCEAR